MLSYQGRNGFRRYTWGSRCIQSAHAFGVHLWRKVYSSTDQGFGKDLIIGNSEVTNLEVIDVILGRVKYVVRLDVTMYDPIFGESFESS